jgi:hypothetical protein
MINKKILKYPDTNISPTIGDTVEYCEEKDLVIDDIIDSPEKQKEWGLDTNGVMVKGEKYGLVFDELGPYTDIKLIKRKS